MNGFQIELCITVAISLASWAQVQQNKVFLVIGPDKSNPCQHYGRRNAHLNYRFRPCPTMYSILQANITLSQPNWLQIRSETQFQVFGLRTKPNCSKNWVCLKWLSSTCILLSMGWNVKIRIRTLNDMCYNWVGPTRIHPYRMR